ncbi:hypothetical protein DM01DRAFT_1340476 [Hesseltinella vesiculosa]|uniref:R3H domain-containing protein n=1 Tax=Hesseltinella vesiculosa TaxID=101127 RepID=A0A1X2G4W3_9FUNG|nr:hypothetical protein DM01DRAFT_1340476 [Hesseltinella vesiculosa]
MGDSPTIVPSHLATSSTGEPSATRKPQDSQGSSSAAASDSPKPPKHRRPRKKKPKTPVNPDEQANDTPEQDASKKQSKQSNGLVAADGNKTASSSKKPRKKKSNTHLDPGSPATADTIKDESNGNATLTNKKKNKAKDKPKGSNEKPRFNKNRAQAQLTTDQNDKPSKPHHADHHHHSRNAKKNGPVADDMASTMAYELTVGSYECMVCWDVIRPAHHTWTCENCWAVFHIDCISKWASKSLKDTSTNVMITAWRCPGCQHKRTALPHGYFCFCGKQKNPNPSRYQTPHTCDQLCKRSRVCPHACVLPCHPGPCPPCTSMGSVTVCFCGKERRQAKCVDTDYDTNAYSCKTICGQRLGCGEHTCQETCHPGLCPPCQVVNVEQECYCGQTTRSTRCGDGLPFASADGHIGHFTCDNKCTKTYDCGVHQCDQGCHPCQSSTTCPYSPERILTCPCGATNMEDLCQPRTSCQDPIPTCGGICHKALPCGHNCPQPCHRGPCNPCELPVKVPCRCQATEFDAICGQETPVRTCDRVCKAIRNCGRHPCRETCCAGAKLKGKKRTPGAERAHDCPLTCERQLSCGKHACQQLCHKGPCAPCLEATFDEIACHCGRTRLDPPIRCGTQLPACPHPCQRESPCGHIRLLQHNCHPDDEPCPPCPILISRQCECGKTELKNIPCYRAAAHCGTVCGKPLACGQHSCQRTCHKGDCLPEDSAECQQLCQRSRQACGHPCQLTCHGDSVCPETNPCEARIRASCACGQHAMDIPCLATADSSGSSETLPCNDFCAKIERNRRLAAALDLQRPDVVLDALGQTTIDSQHLTNDEDVPYLSSDDLGYYDEEIRQFYLANRSWALAMEQQLIAFANDANATMFHFKPMRPIFRRFIHRYAIHFNIAAEALDPEPQRSVCLRKSLGASRVPPILLSKAVHDPNLMAPPTTSALLAAKALYAKKNDTSSTATATSDNGFTTPGSAVPAKTPRPPVNALKVGGLAFGILQEDLDTIVKPVLLDITYTTQWGQEAADCILVPALGSMTDMEQREDAIWNWKKQLQNAFFFKDMPATVECCWINQAGEITWTEKSTRSPSSSVTTRVQPMQLNRFDVLQQDAE